MTDLEDLPETYREPVRPGHCPLPATEESIAAVADDLRMIQKLQTERMIAGFPVTPRCPEGAPVSEAGGNINDWLDAMHRHYQRDDEQLGRECQDDLLMSPWGRLRTWLGEYRRACVTWNDDNGALEVDYPVSNRTHKLKGRTFLGVYYRYHALLQCHVLVINWLRLRVQWRFRAFKLRRIDL